MPKLELNRSEEFARECFESSRELGIILSKAKDDLMKSKTTFQERDAAFEVLKVVSEDLKKALSRQLCEKYKLEFYPKE